MNPLHKISADRACHITSRYELDEELEPLLTPEITPAEFISALLDQQHYIDCVRFIAHSLPKREAIWWACLASRQTLTPDSSALRQQTLQITEKWVRQPTEELRRQAEKLAQKCKHKTPESWAAMAAFWSTGNILDTDEQPMPAPPYLFAHAVTGAIGLAAVADTEDEINERYRRMISQGIDLALGGKGMIHDDPASLLLNEATTA